MRLGTRYSFTMQMTVIYILGIVWFRIINNFFAGSNYKLNKKTGGPFVTYPNILIVWLRIISKIG